MNIDNMVVNYIPGTIDRHSQPKYFVKQKHNNDFILYCKETIGILPYPPEVPIDLQKLLNTLRRIDGCILNDEVDKLLDSYRINIEDSRISEYSTYILNDLSNPFLGRFLLKTFISDYAWFGRKIISSTLNYKIGKFTDTWFDHECLIVTIPITMFIVLGIPTVIGYYFIGDKALLISMFVCKLFMLFLIMIYFWL